MAFGSAAQRMAVFASKMGRGAASKVRRVGSSAKGHLNKNKNVYAFGGAVGALAGNSAGGAVLNNRLSRKLESTKGERRFATAQGVGSGLVGHGLMRLGAKYGKGRKPSKARGIGTYIAGGPDAYLGYRMTSRGPASQRVKRTK